MKEIENLKIEISNNLNEIIKNIVSGNISNLGDVVIEICKIIDKLE